MTITQELIDAERKRFETSAQLKYLDFSKTKDAWGKEIYFYTHVEAMWQGWQAAISQHKVVQDGYVLVPKKPTDEMILAAMEDIDYLDSEEGMVKAGIRKEWKAMIAAAPSDSKALVESEPNRFIKDPSPQGAGQLIPVKAETVKQDAELTEPMKKVLRYAMAQVQDFEEAECLLHGFRRSTVDKAFTWLNKALQAK
jgi:hypothetical protein